MINMLIHHNHIHINDTNDTTTDDTTNDHTNYNSAGRPCIRCASTFASDCVMCILMMLY